MKRIRLLIVMMSVCAVLQAQETPREDKTVKKNKLVQIDLDFGTNIDMAYRREGNMLTRLSDKKTVIPAINFRLQHFFSQKWGWYANIRLGMPKKYDQDCYAELAGKLEPHYYVKNLITYEQEPLVAPCVDFGAVYRIENSRWAFYPRLGIGMNYVEYQEVLAELKKKGGNELYQVNYRFGNEDANRNREIFVVSAGISVNYKLSERCYLLLNANYTQPIGEHKCFEYVKDLYTQESVERRAYKSSTLGRDLTISVGLGFPIYLQKNKKEKSTRKERMQKIMEQKRTSYGLFSKETK